MMDSHDTNQPLKQGELEEEKKQLRFLKKLQKLRLKKLLWKNRQKMLLKLSTKEEVLLRLKEVAQDAENANKQELDGLKQTFYKIHNAEIEGCEKKRS